MARGKYLVFARKWRPQAFEDVVGQEHITRTLQNSIAAGRIGHAFLFIGSRGIGKTTTARILAKALNCDASDGPTANPCGTCENCTSISEGNSIDVIEIDGASNNSVDDVREIRENVRLVPSRSRYKVYIIDEVHQLSSGAFNALLKTLEEPPAHAIFILATTEAHKVPATIISRCQRFDFRRVPVERIIELLRAILDQEGIKYSQEALHAVARAAEGGIRDAESILDQLVSYCDGEITFKDVFDVLGLVDWRVLHELCDTIVQKDISRQLQLVADIVDSGKDLSQFLQEIMRYFRNLLVCKTGDPRALLSLPDDEIARMQAHAEKFTLSQLIKLVEQFAELTKGFDSQFAQRIALEALLIRISKRSVEVSVDAVIEKLMQIAEQGLPPGEVIWPADREPVMVAPAVEETGPVTLTTDSLPKLWPALIDAASSTQISLRVGLEQARPLEIADDVLVLEFTAAMEQAIKLVEKPENRRCLESALRDLTANVKTFHCTCLEKEPLEEEAEQRPQVSVGARHIAPEQARAAMANPHVARVVEVFRGRIVEIRHDIQSAHHE